MDDTLEARVNATLALALLSALLLVALGWEYAFEETVGAVSLWLLLVIAVLAR